MAEVDPSAASRLVPLESPPFAMRMGVRRLDVPRWIDVDAATLDADLALKARLLQEDRDRYLIDDGTPSSADGARELEEAIDSWWTGSARGGPGPAADDHPLVRAASRTQEDWCLVDVRSDVPVLAAGCVCFPTRWVLTEKLGLPVTAVHDPVAGYRATLADPVERFIARLEPDRIVWRANWNLVDDPALSQPYIPEPGRRLAAGEDEVADLVFFRVERQTLRRLPRSGIVAFGIRVHQRPVRQLAADPNAAARLVAAVDSLPPETFAYKGLPAFWDLLREWLARRLRTA